VNFSVYVEHVPMFELLYSPEAAQRKEILKLKMLNTNYHPVTELNAEKNTQQREN